MLLFVLIFNLDGRKSAMNLLHGKHLKNQRGFLFFQIKRGKIQTAKEKFL
jgi:hypothetical protein